MKVHIRCPSLTSYYPQGNPFVKERCIADVFRRTSVAHPHYGRRQRRDLCGAEGHHPAQDRYSRWSRPRAGVCSGESTPSPPFPLDRLSSPFHLAPPVPHSHIDRALPVTPDRLLRIAVRHSPSPTRNERRAWPRACSGCDEAFIACRDPSAPSPHLPRSPSLSRTLPPPPPCRLRRSAASARAACGLRRCYDFSTNRYNYLNYNV